MSENPTSGTGSHELPNVDDLPDLPDLPEVTQADIEAAMGVNSVPDEVRLTSADPDETRQTMDSTGQLRAPADEAHPSGAPGE